MNTFELKDCDLSTLSKKEVSEIHGGGELAKKIGYALGYVAGKLGIGQECIIERHYYCKG